MDSTIFIRSRRVLAVWLIGPALILAIAESGSRGFYGIQKVSYMHKQSLARLIPEMIAAGGQFDEFVRGYQISTEGSVSMESASIDMLNAAADAALFKITSINLVQKRAGDSSAVKAAIHVEGDGTGHSIVAFLQKIKARDPLIYEDSMELTRSVENSEVLRAEMNLGKIYVEGEGGNP